MYLATKELAELPKLLTRTAGNSAFYAGLSRVDGISDIGESAGYSAQPGYRLIRVDHRPHGGSANDFEIALVDDAKASVAFYAKVTLLSVPEVSSRYIARHRVWRSASTHHSLALSEISRTVLFGYILPRYDLLLGEDAITGDGKFYWHRQMSRALQLGFHVYVYDQTTQALRSIPTDCELSSLQDQIWSSTRREPLQGFISTGPLDQLEY